MKWLIIAVVILAAGVILCGFQQPPAPSRKANHKAADAAQNDSAKKQTSPQSRTAITSGNSDAQSQGVKSNGNENIQIVTPAPEKPVDLIERIISIIGVLCTVALAIIGIRGIYIALGTLQEMKGQREQMGKQVEAAVLQVSAMHKQITEMSVQSAILEKSVTASQQAAVAAKTSADIAAGVAIPKLVVHELSTGTTGAAALPAMLQFPKVNLIIKNYGQTPALLRSWSIIFTCDKLPDPPRYSGYPGSGIVLTHEVIKPNEPYTLTVVNYWNRQEFSLDDVGAIIDHRKMLNVYGYVLYGDIFGTPLQRFKFFATALNLADSWIDWRTEFAPDAYVGTDQFLPDESPEEEKKTN
jgi:hypothetical protein